MRFFKKTIMDIKDIDTECLVETTILCGERMLYIIRKYIRFFFRELGLIDLFPLSIISSNYRCLVSVFHRHDSHVTVCFSDVCRESFRSAREMAVSEDRINGSSIS